MSNRRKTAGARRAQARHNAQHAPWTAGLVLGRDGNPKRGEGRANIPYGPTRRGYGRLLRATIQGQEESPDE